MSHMRKLIPPPGQHTDNAPGCCGSEAGDMPPGNETASAKQAQLNRTRENQRRCRKRRKEYLEEMEEKVRQYQLNEVQVSVEMQSAARKVVEENRQLVEQTKRQADENGKLRKENVSLREENTQLRAQLRRHGINDECVLTAPAVDTVVSPRRTSASPSTSTSIQHLERLLQPRKSTKLEPSESYALQLSQYGGTRPVDTDMDLQSAEAAIPSASSLWLVNMSGAVPASAIPPESRYQYHQPALDTDGRALSRVDAAIALKHLGSASADDVRSSTTPNDSNLAPTAHRPAGDLMHTSSMPFDYDSNMSLISGYAGYGQHYHTVRQDRLSVASSTRSSTASSNNNSQNNHLQAPRAANNCAVVTNLIVGLTGVPAEHVRHELGCLPGVAECHVDDARFSTVMSRYATATTMGM